MTKVVYRPTRVGVILKDPADPAKTAALTPRWPDILVLWNDGFAPEVVEKAAREWYPLAKKVVTNSLPSQKQAGSDI